MLSMEEILRIRRLRWLGHVSRMTEDRIHHKIAFSELKEGKRPQTKPKQRWCDVLKKDLKTVNINIENWREEAADRKEWRCNIQNKANEHQEKAIKTTKEKRLERHEREDQVEWKCPMCDFKRQGIRGRQYVLSHLKQKHGVGSTSNESENNTSCTTCGQNYKTKSGLSSHVRHKHPNVRIDTTHLPIKLYPTVATASNAESQSTTNLPSQPSQPALNTSDLQCPACGRAFKNKAGLKCHLRNVNCKQILERGNVGHDGRH
ncbi:hypothetical protein WDU94_013857 [Cyamophila willieti]